MRVRRAAVSAWTASIEAGCGERRRAAASDYCDGLRRSRGQWQQDAAGDGGPLQVIRAAASEAG